MKKFRYGLYSFLLAMMCLFLTKPVVAHAATASFWVSSATVTQGGLVTVTVTVSADTGLGGYQCAVVYDSDILEWISDSDMGGGGGRITYVEYNVDGATQDSFTLQFRGSSVGSSSVYIEDSTFLQAFDVDLDDLSVSASGGTVTVQAPVVASGNCNLESLSVYGVNEEGESVAVSLSPAFSSDTTEYTASVTSDILYYAINAVPEDDSAEVYTSGTDLGEGFNTTTITVVAENGNRKVYEIYTDKEAAPPVDNSMLEVTVDGTDYVIQRDFDGSLLPEGFEKGTLSYAEQAVSCGISLNKELTLLYLIEKDGEQGAFYLYKKDDGTFYLLTQVTVTQMTYTILEEEGVQAPEGFEQAEVTVGGRTLIVWKKGDYCLLYAMNYSGKKGWYLYDITEGTIQRFDSEFYQPVETVTSDNTEKPTATATDVDWYQRYKEMKEQGEKEKKISTALVIAFGAASILFLVVMIAVVLRYRRQGKPGKEEDLQEGTDSSAEEFSMPDKEELSALITEETASVGAETEEMDQEHPEDSLLDFDADQLVSEVLGEADEMARQDVPENLKPEQKKEIQEPEEDDTLDSFEIF